MGRIWSTREPKRQTQCEILVLRAAHSTLGNKISFLPTIVPIHKLRVEDRPKKIPGAHEAY